MRVRRLTIENFRGSLNGTVSFGSGHTLLVGGNNVGKSTVCEALDLVLGPERLARRPVIDEHDAARLTLRGFLEKIIIPPGEALLQVVGNVGVMLAAAQGRTLDQPDVLELGAIGGCGGSQPTLSAALAPAGMTLLTRSSLLLAVNRSGKLTRPGSSARQRRSVTEGRSAAPQGPHCA